MERMDHFIAANGINDADKKKSMFLAGICLATYSLLRNLISPSKPGEKSYSDLVATLKSIQHHQRWSNIWNLAAVLGDLEKLLLLLLLIYAP